MKQRYHRPYRYKFTRPPRALRKARLENIAIVPASLLPLTKTIHQLLHTLPDGGVFLCHVSKNTKQRRILERVGKRLESNGHTVTHLPLEQVA
jgi:hypothetical protein